MTVPFRETLRRVRGTSGGRPLDARALAVPDRAPLTLAEVDEQVRDYARSSVAAETVRGYANDWRSFSAWCDGHGLEALPADPSTLARYLTAQAARLKVATLERHRAAIGEAHRRKHLPSPTEDAGVRAVWKGIKRQHGTAQQGKAPATTDELRRMVATLPPGPLGVRDHALLLLGFAGAFRRSELVALDVGDVAEQREGLVVRLARSKTDQEGEGSQKGIPFGSTLETCPVRAVKAWLEVLSANGSQIADAPLFVGVDRHGRLLPGRLSDRAVARAVQRAAAAAGLDPTRYAGHSLRAGLVTSAALADQADHAIARQTGHKSMAVLARYIRPAGLFKQNVAARVGL